MDAGQAAAALGVDPDSVTLEARDGRWLARLADGRMAWRPSSAEGEALLARERRILRLIEERCTFRAPRVLGVSQSGWDLRDPVPGDVDPAALYHRLAADDAAARRLGRQIGAALAQQHGAMGRAELAGWLPRTVGWPMPDAWLWERLPAVADDAALLARIRRALAAYHGLAAPEPVLAHCDLGLHNIAVEPASGDLAGIFDYGGAALADRRQDFRYLIFDHESEAMLDGALAAYQAAPGLSLDRDVIRLMNAACAAGFLAFRHGHAPDEPWCGRTLAQDLAWTDRALSRAGF